MKYFEQIAKKVMIKKYVPHGMMGPGNILINFLSRPLKKLKICITISQ